MHKDIDRHITITDYSYLLSQSRIGLDGDRQQVRGLLFEQRSSFIVENVYTYIYIYTLEWFECMEPSTVHCVTLNASLTFLVNLSLEIHASQLELRGHRDMYLEHRKV